MDLSLKNRGVMTPNVPGNPLPGVHEYGSFLVTQETEKVRKGRFSTECFYLIFVGHMSICWAIDTPVLDFW